MRSIERLTTETRAAIEETLFALQRSTETTVIVPGYIRHVQILLAEIDRLREENAKLAKGGEHLVDFYTVRLERLKDLCKEHGIWDQAATIFANGTAAPNENPTYAQHINALRHDRDTLAAMVGELQQTSRKLLDSTTGTGQWWHYKEKLDTLLTTLPPAALEKLKREAKRDLLADVIDAYASLNKDAFIDWLQVTRKELEAKNGH